MLNFKVIVDVELKDEEQCAGCFFLNKNKCFYNGWALPTGLRRPSWCMLKHMTFSKESCGGELSRDILNTIASGNVKETAASGYYNSLTKLADEISFIDTPADVRPNTDIEKLNAIFVE